MIKPSKVMTPHEQCATAKPHIPSDITKVSSHVRSAFLESMMLLKKAPTPYSKVETPNKVMALALGKNFLDVVMQESDDEVRKWKWDEEDLPDVAGFPKNEFNAL